jgi:RNA polymerase sigma-70 factor (ECF subfamily)
MSATPSALDTRPSLLVRIRDPRDAESWNTFVGTYAPVVYRYGRRRGLQEADAADVTQEVMAEVARLIHTFEYQPQRGHFRDWLLALTRFKLMHFFRHRGRNVAEPAGEAAGEGEDSEWTDEFNAQVLRSALERCRPHFEAATWRAFERVWLDNVPGPAAARELDVPIEAVYVAKSRVLKRLKEEILLLAEDLPHCVPLD